MSEEPKSFTVKDRRHFTPEGETREPDDPVEVPGVVETPKGPSEAEENPPIAATAASGPSAPGEPVSFSQFILSLAAQAGLLLSGQLGPESPREALAEARSLISILEMLRDKTEGRRTKDEDEIVDGALYELRMGYVARAREAGE
jgi:uncharacterized protein DUF1844